MICKQCGKEICLGFLKKKPIESIKCENLFHTGKHIIRLKDNPFNFVRYSNNL